MRNKLIILSFACLLGFSSFSQDELKNDQQTKISIYPNPAVEFLVVQIVCQSSFQLASKSWTGGVNVVVRTLNESVNSKIDHKSTEYLVDAYGV